MLKLIQTRGNNKIFTRLELYLRYLMSEKTWAKIQRETNERMFNELMMKI